MKSFRPRAGTKSPEYQTVPQRIELNLVVWGKLARHTFAGHSSAKFCEE
jgi:hypothetical protein